MNEAEARHYLRPSSADFWRWGDDGRALLWIDGRTVAFLPELHAAVVRLAPAGLPPFGSVVMALAAMKAHWRVDPSQRGAFAGYLRSALSAENELSPAHTDLLAKALARLDVLSALPDDLRKGADAKALLVELFFENVPPAHAGPGAHHVTALLAERIPEFDDPGIPLAVPHAADALAVVSALAAARTLTNPDAIRMRQQTGLEQPPAPPELHISDTARGLIGSLRNDAQLGGVARLAAAILAVIATPRRLRPEADLPLGGFSDIANRGPLDRLLLTELAHDDLTLAVRVALNEALYLRRESPRTPQSFTRTVLIDAGIRLWGLPRIFSTAVALAFAATTPKEAAFQVFTTHANRLLPVDLASRPGLVSHLAHLETRPHPGAVLPALAKTVRARGDDHDETILLTHPDTRADHAFQKSVRDADLFPLLMATVDSCGAFDLAALSPAGERPIARARLKLDDILKPAADEAPLVSPKDDLPLYFRLQMSPFRLPTPSNLTTPYASRSHGLIGVVKRTLTQWPLPGEGRQLATLPNGNLLGMGVFEDQATVVTAVWDPMDHTLHLSSASLSPKQGVVHQRITGGIPPQAIAGHNGAILLIYRDRADAYSFDRAVKIATADFRNLTRSLGSRFFEGAGGAVQAFAYDSASLRVVPVPLPTSPIAVFTRLGTDGPLGLYADGSIHDSLGHTLVGPSVWAKSALRPLHQVSGDGHRLVVSLAPTAETKHLAVDLTQPTPAWTPIKEDTVTRFLLGPCADYATVHDLPLRRAMQAACIFKDDLTLVSHKGKQLTLESETAVLRYTGHYTHGGRRQTFRPLGPKNSAIRGLHLATWADGSRAWMDARGLLHLRSSDPQLPELTLILQHADHWITAWSSDGKTYGQTSLLLAPPTGTTQGLRLLLRAFVARLT